MCSNVFRNFLREEKLIFEIFSGVFRFGRINLEKN